MAASDGTKAPLPTSPVAVGKDGGGAVPLPLKDILGTNAGGPGVTGEFNYKQRRAGPVVDRRRRRRQLRQRDRRPRLQRRSAPASSLKATPPRPR